MKRRSIILLVPVLIIGLLAVGPAFAAEKMPRVLNMATMPPGMIVNAQAVGISDIVAKYTPLTLKVKPSTNSMVWIPMTITGEIELGLTASIAARFAFTGTKIFKNIAKKAKVKNFPLRVVTGGAPLRVNFVVRGNDPAKTCADLKGRKVVTFREGTQFDFFTKARLANGGLSMADIIKVPAANPIESARSVMEGRADAGDLAVGAPIATEAVAKVKARWLSLDPSPAAVKRMKKWLPTAYVAKVPGGVFIGVPEDQYLMHMDIVLFAHKDSNAAAIYTIVKALYDHNAELVKRPGLMEWQTKRFVSKQHQVPYHDGAIKLFKEKGIWSKDMDAFQKARLAEAPK